MSLELERLAEIRHSGDVRLRLPVRRVASRSGPRKAADPRRYWPPFRHARPVRVLIGTFDTMRSAPDIEPDDGRFEPHRLGDCRGRGRRHEDRRGYLPRLDEGCPRPWRTFSKCGLAPGRQRGDRRKKPVGTPHPLAMADGPGPLPSLPSPVRGAGERGDKRIGCFLENRGLVRVELLAHSGTPSTGTRSAHGDLSAKNPPTAVDLTSRLRDTDSPDGSARYGFPTSKSAGRAATMSVRNRPTCLPLIPEGEPLEQVLFLIEDYARTISGLDALGRLGSRCGLRSWAPAGAAVLKDSVRDIPARSPRWVKTAGPAHAPRPAVGMVWGQSGVGPSTPDNAILLPGVDHIHAPFERWAIDSNPPDISRCSNGPLRDDIRTRPGEPPSCDRPGRAPRRGLRPRMPHADRHCALRGR